MWENPWEDDEDEQDLEDELEEEPDFERIRLYSLMREPSFCKRDM